MRWNFLFFLSLIVLLLGLGPVGCGDAHDDDDSAGDDDDDSAGDDDDDSAGDDDDSAGDDDDDSAGDDDDSPDSLAGTWSGPSEGTATVKEQSLVIPCVGFAAVDVDLVDEVNVVVGGHMNCVPVEMPTADPVDIVIPGGFAVGEQGQGDTPLGPVTVSVIQGAEGESLVVTGTGSIVHSSFGPIEVLITAEVHKEPTAGDDDDSAE